MKSGGSCPCVARFRATAYIKKGFSIPQISTTSKIRKSKIEIEEK